MSAVPAEVPKQSTEVALAALAELLNRANAVHVTNADEYAAAVEVCQRVAAMKKLRTDERLAITRKMDEAKDGVMGFFARTFLIPLAAVDDVIRGKLRAYDAEQKRLAEIRRREAEAAAQRIRDEANRKAKEERDRAELKAKQEREEAERQRLERIRQTEEAAKARAAGDAAAAKAAQDAATAAARAAQAAEHKAEAIVAKGEDKAAALAAHAESIVAPVIFDDRPKVKGNVRRTVWKYKVTDPSKVARAFLAVDEMKIGATVRALKKDAEAIVGGIEVYEEPDLSIRAAKP